MNYPEGTTKEQWDRYEVDLKNHEERVAKTRPNPNDYPTQESFQFAELQWDMMRSCDAPNKPGYFRANND